MAYTLADFLNDRITPEIRILTDRMDLSKINIESISVQEMPIGDFVSANELVLSTAIHCTDNEENFLQFIQALCASKAAGVLLTFEDPTVQVPDKVLKTAYQAGLPIFQIPWEYRFAEIQTSVLQKLSESRLKVYLNLQTRLINLYFDSQPLERAVGMISDTLKMPVAVTNVSMEQLVAVRFPQNPEHLPAPMTIPVMISNRKAGYLELYPRLDGKAPDPELTGKYICFPLSLWFNHKAIEDLLTERLKNDFVWDLANHNYFSFDSMVQQGFRLHFDLTRPYTCIALKATQLEETDGGSYSNEIIALTEKMDKILRAAGKKMKREIMFVNRNLDQIIYFENAGLQPEADIDGFLDWMDEELRKEFPAYQFQWGISEVSLQQKPLDVLYQNATLALNYCVNSNSNQYRFTYRDTRETQLLSVLFTSPEAQEIAEGVLHVLQEDSRATGMNLIETLTEYSNCNYNISMAARNLHVHRQSLLYRLEKIEELTGLSLKNHRDSFFLELCVRILSNNRPTSSGFEFEKG